MHASIWVAWGVVFAFFCLLAVGMRLVIGRVALNPLKIAGMHSDRMADATCSTPLHRAAAMRSVCC